MIANFLIGNHMPLLKLKLLYRTGDDAILCYFIHFHKVGAVTGNPYQKLTVLLRFLLGGIQGLIIHHIELHMVDPQIMPGLYVVPPHLKTFLALELGGG